MLRTICYAAPHQHRSVLEYLTPVRPSPHSQTCADACPLSRTLIPADTNADAKMSASAYLWTTVEVHHGRQRVSENRKLSGRGCHFQTTDVFQCLSYGRRLSSLDRDSIGETSVLHFRRCRSWLHVASESNSNTDVDGSVCEAYPRSGRSRHIGLLSINLVSRQQGFQ